MSDLRFKAEYHLMKSIISIGTSKQVVLYHGTHRNAKELHLWHSVLVLPDVDRVASLIDHVRGEIYHIVIIVHPML